MTRQHRHPFDGLKPTEAPACLKARVLQTARSAEKRSPLHRNLVDRMWESRWLRPAWAAVVAALIAFNILSAASPAPVAPSPRSVGTYLLTGRHSPQPPALRGKNVIPLTATAPLLEILLDQEQPKSAVKAPRTERKEGAV